MDDLITFRRQVRALVEQLGMDLADQVRVVMCATELAENQLKHASGGRCSAAVVCGADGRSGIRIECEDAGPGIEDMDLVLHDRPDQQCDLLGGGLIGVRRVADSFEVESDGSGTRVAVTLLDAASVPVSATGGWR